MKYLAPLTLLLLAAIGTEGQTTNPIRYTWIATSCETWDCAASALAVAHGDKSVFALPTGSDERPWVILRRVEEGSVYVPQDEPYSCHVFDQVADATTHMLAMDGCHAPMIVSVADGRSVVTSLTDCKAIKRRAVR
jgi:hypothetical protein